MDTAVEQGINFFDSADVYGGPQSPDIARGYGTSEEITGRWLKRSGRRDDIVLAKVYQPMGLGPNDRRGRRGRRAAGNAAWGLNPASELGEIRLLRKLRAGQAQRSGRNFH